MFSPAYLDQLVDNLINSVVLLAIITIISIVLYQILRRVRQVTRKKRLQYRARIRYVAIFIFILLAARIWIEGFSHLLTVLSLVAAGLVVTNKESIMNLVGALIIHWRAVFTEGDFIQVQNYTGYVVSIGPMYFKLYEVKSLESHVATGRTLRIPNGLIIANPVVICTPEMNLLQYQLKIPLLIKNYHEEMVAQVEEIARKVISEHHARQVNKPKLQAFESNKMLSTWIHLEPKIKVLISAEKVDEMMILIDYYAYPNDASIIQQTFWKTLLAQKILTPPCEQKKDDK